MHRLLFAGIIAFLLSAPSSYSAEPVLSEPETAATAPVFDEARLGVLTSIDDANEDDGAFVTGVLFFDPWGHNQAQGWDKLMRPRIHLGGSVATNDEPNQVYAGLSWTADLNERFFLELGLGGTLHDGDLDSSDGGDGPMLGCRALFREYVAAGFRLTENWNLVAQMEHSSHAKLCDGPNEGLSRAGVMVGYRF